MNAKIFSFILILALASLACGFDINLPKAQQPGPLVTDEVVVPGAGSDGMRLKLSFGAGEMKLSPGAEENLVDGTASYNYEEFKPEIISEDENVEIKMGNMDFSGFPSFDEIKNEWDFQLGNMPMDLEVSAGAYDAAYEFGGLSLTALKISDGAADVELAFSDANPSEMSIFKYDTGASNIKMTGLSNANFSVFNFTGGAGDYTLDFSGELQRDAAINIETGLSNMILVIPEGVHAVVNVESGASNINAVPGWEQSGNTYTQNGEGPTLTFVIEIGAGNLTISR